jgi:predicted RNA-binding Zn ribbon-like protein
MDNLSRCFEGLFAKMPSGLEARTFELIAGDAALDLVNTLDWRFRDSGTEELIGGYDDVAGFTEQTGRLSAKQAKALRRGTSTYAGNRVVGEVRELREALADLLYSGLDGMNSSGASIKTLERFFQQAREQTKLVRDGARLRWEWAGAETKAEFPLWLLARAASRLMLSENVQKVRACDNPACRWLFLDTSKNHTRRWCDMKICGNRMKARRFKAQHKAGV